MKLYELIISIMQGAVLMLLFLQILGNKISTYIMFVIVLAIICFLESFLLYPWIDERCQDERDKN